MVGVEVVAPDAEEKTGPESRNRQDGESELGGPVHVWLAHDGRGGDDDHNHGDESGDDDDLSAEGGLEAVHDVWG